MILVIFAPFTLKRGPPSFSAKGKVLGVIAVDLHFVVDKRNGVVVKDN